MRFRKLRIAWSIACVLVCQPLLLFWALSYSEMNAWTMPIGRTRGMIVMIVAGQLAIAVNDTPFAWRSTKSDLTDNYQPQSWVFDEHQLIVPMWLPVMLVGALALIPWIRWSTRFSLRAILIFTTLVAALLGLILYSMGK